jgi:hypothetical protein
MKPFGRNFHHLGQNLKGAFTLAIFARNFALSLHVLLTKIIFFITKHASLVRNRTRYRAVVKAPLGYASILSQESCKIGPWFKGQFTRIIKRVQKCIAFYQKLGFL